MKNFIKNYSKITDNQSGQASIIISIILVIVMSLITVAVSETSTRNTTNNNTDQINNQAYLAAESGVNDAINILKQAGSSVPTGTTNCSSFINANSLNNVLSHSPYTAYSCLNVDLTPSTLVYAVTQKQSTVVKVTPSVKSQTLTFQWNPSNTTGNLNTCSPAQLEFVPLSYWTCPYALLRVDIYNGNGINTSPQDSAQLQADTNSFYIFPTYSGTSYPYNLNNEPITKENYSTIGTYTIGNYYNVNQVTNPAGTGPTNQPTVVLANCTATNCTETFTFPSTNKLTTGYVRMTSIYSDAGNVTISADNSDLFLYNQVEIDSTGISQNATQRIDVRVPIANGVTTTAPNYAVAYGVSFCKKFLLNSSSATPSYPLNYAPAGDLADSGNFPGDQTGTIGQNGGANGPLCGGALKPAIYLYPTKSELVNVKVSYPTGLKTSIPSYNSEYGWNVEANPNGNLTNLSDGKQYPYLYWEGNTDSFNFDMKQGFVVPGKDTAAFLTHELSVIGLNKNEINGFLQFWVPKMQNNPYSLIHFAGTDYTNMAPLNITPKPDALLRVFMAEEPISQPVKVTPQHFTQFHRTGFTAVEWGGSILN